MPPESNEWIDPKMFATSVRALLDEDPRRYRNFGVFWYFVKDALRRYFDQHAMPILGDYVDETVVDRMPKGLGEGELLAAAADEYRENASFNLGGNEVVDMDGEHFMLIDPDIEG